MLSRNRSQLRADVAQTDFFKVLANSLFMKSKDYRICSYRNTGLLKLVGHVNRLDDFQSMSKAIRNAISFYNKRFQPDDIYTLMDSDYKIAGTVRYMRELYACEDEDSYIEILAIEGDFDGWTLSASINLV